jgi:hypothetical protein
MNARAVPVVDEVDEVDEAVDYVCLEQSLVLSFFWA